MIWSLVCSGFGQFYNGDFQKGGAFFIFAILFGIGFWPLLIPLAIWSIGDAHHRAVEINQELDKERQYEIEQKNKTEEIASTRTKVADLVIKVEKIYALNKSGLLSEEEFRSKVSHLISELSEKKPFENAEDFLTALIPLVGSDALNGDDLSRIKAVL
ncbi:hypothetical protein LT85_0746 [Collimonas arenae]|uniref:Uncharacterized protein n=2 Tax=Collimonas arenae TaxID=279058 RepID=A0A0A1F5W0_9BURK|nr:hypothetical protein LT85_0746 [Collimonas arenae]